jgi:hypothetical protein
LFFQIYSYILATHLSGEGYPTTSIHGKCGSLIIRNFLQWLSISVAEPVDFFAVLAPACQKLWLRLQLQPFSPLIYKENSKI